MEGLPQGKELEILGSVRDKVPAEVFTTPYRNPWRNRGGATRQSTTGLRAAEGTGYEQRGVQLISTRTGEPLRLELLGFDPSFERYACLTNRRSSGSASV